MTPPKPPPFPPRDESDSAAPDARRQPGTKDIVELDLESRPSPLGKRQTLPVPPLGEPADAASVETARPPTRAKALERQPTNSGLGYGVPSPSFGGDTDFDTGEGDGPLASLRRTSSFERDPAAGRALALSDPAPPRDALELGFGEDDSGSEALDMVGRTTEPLGFSPAEPSRRADPLAELRERYALGDFSGALTIAEALLEDDPDNADAQRYAESCRDVLKQMYAARLGSLTQVPIVAIPAEQLRWLTLDHRSGFLLSHVDGVSTLEEILDISGMNHLEAMRIIYELLQQKVIALQ